MDQQAFRNLAPSTLINRNVTVTGHRTSVRLEQPMWDALEEICRRERKVLNQLVTEIDNNRQESSLTAAIRVTIMLYFKTAATERGHVRAGHGVLRKQAAAGNGAYPHQAPRRQSAA
jgi:predicted DNA-binding ribbon-helix-helix protein